MARRKTYTKVLKENQVRAAHVEGMGDVPFIGFHCLNANCQVFNFAKEEEIDGDFQLVCASCGFVHENGGTTKFYDYSLAGKDQTTGEYTQVIETGTFEVSHREHLESSARYKYCIICNCLKPLEQFGRHSARRTQRQGECRLCKTQYNAIKNQTRIADQHREAAQKRRLHVEVTGTTQKIDTNQIFRRFENRCFNCETPLVDEGGTPLNGAFQIDHTLPAFFLWGLTTANATLLCNDCNSAKSGGWPRDFYSSDKLKALSAKTGIDYALLAGDPQFNPEAIDYLSSAEHVIALVERYARYPHELYRLRNRILSLTGFDFLQVPGDSISPEWVAQADKAKT